MTGLLIIVALFAAVFAQVNAGDENVFLDRLRLPKGFSASVFGHVPFARSMDLSPNGTLFVASYNFQNISGVHKDLTRVWALRDEDGDGVAEIVKPVTELLWVPNGIAYLNGDLYVALIDRVYRYDDIENHLEPREPSATIISPDRLPDDTWHGWRYLRAANDKLYLAVGAPCNIPGVRDDGVDCLDGHPTFASIQEIDPKTGSMTTVAKGIRNSVGFTQHPATGELWFTDNGRDSMKPDRNRMPPDELNRLTLKDKDVPNYGFPYCYGYHLGDAHFNYTDEMCKQSDFKPAAMQLGPHVASLGVRVYQASDAAFSFPKAYHHSLFIAEHGSWDRQPPNGYRVTRVRPDRTNTKAESYEVFLDGFLSSPLQQCASDDECPGTSVCQMSQDIYVAPYYCSGWGRPADVQQMKDGALLVSDEQNGVVYRIVYKGEGGSSKGLQAVVGLCFAFLAGFVLVMIGLAVRNKLREGHPVEHQPLMAEASA